MKFPRAHLALILSLSSFLASSAFVSPLSRRNTYVGSYRVLGSVALNDVSEEGTAETPALEVGEAPTGDVEVSAEAEKAESDDEADAEDADPAEKFQRERHTLFVGNLPFETTDAEVRDIFAEVGSVELVSVPRDRVTGNARGFAFVDMGSPEELQKAIETVDGTMIGGRTVRVSESLPKGEAKKTRRRSDVEEGTKKIYVGNLSFDTTREQLLDFYSEFGDVKDVYVPININTGSSRGFAFVTMSEEDADRAIEESNGEMFMGRRIVASVPLPPGEKPARSPPRTKIYVGNLSFYTVPDTLRELFEEYGQVHDCYLPEDLSTGGSRGFGFVTMDAEDAAAAIDATDGYELDGRIIRVNEAQPKGRNFGRDYDDDSADDNETD